jgi:ribosome-binding factor A
VSGRTPDALFTILMKDGNRPQRVAALIRRELATIIPRELEGPYAHKITLTDVVVSRDFSSAQVFFSLLTGSREARQAASALNRAAGHFRHLLAGRLTQRSVPRLHFQFDESLERGDRTDALIARAISEDKQHPHD